MWVFGYHGKLAIRAPGLHCWTSQQWHPNRKCPYEIRILVSLPYSSALFPPTSVASVSGPRWLRRETNLRKDVGSLWNDGHTCVAWQLATEAIDRLLRFGERRSP